MAFGSILLLAAACGSFGSQPEAPSPPGEGDDAAVDTGADVDAVDAADESQNYPRVVRNAKPVSYFRLDERDAGPAVDEAMRNSELGTVGAIQRGAPPLVVGGASLKITGGQIRFTDESIVFNGVAPFTVELWLQPLSVGGSSVFILERDNEDGNGYDLSLTNGRLSFRRRVTGSIDRLVADAGPVIPLETYYVVATYDGATMRIYLDAVEVATGPSSIALQNNSGRLELGRSTDGLDGFADELAIYGRALPPEEIAAHYAAGRK